ncbi:MAG: PorV/PorQ family protein [Ignavibacteria bacterium]|nr:PorV/PorQ family protein [Ignavibacteria bacterium]
MKYIKRLFFIFLMLVCISFDAFGSGQNRAGTAAAPQLRIPVGSRYLAMGGADVALVSGLEAIFWNPAGVSISETDANAIFSYRQYIADMSMNFVAISGKFGEFGTIGLSFRSLNIGDINVTTMDQPDGNGQIINPSFFIAGLTYSKQLSDRISIGVNFNLINESWPGVSATGFSLDAGVQYRNLFSVPNLSLGVTVKNLGAPMEYGGTALFVQGEEQTGTRGTTFYEVSAQSAELPSEISLGVSYTRNIDDENLLTVAGTFVNNNYTYDNYKAGLEYSYKNILYVRGGYLFAPESTDDTPNIFEDYTVGAGLNFKEFTNIDVSVDYAYIPVKFFDANNVFSISLGL